ncbi:MAG: hypothetical protein PVF17_04065 [Ignavibacteria bacterium]|jgi:hypothetical protein
MKLRLVLSIFVLVSLTSYSQYNGNNFSVGIYGLYTTTASLFLNPNAPDIVLRNEAFVIKDILNPGMEFRYRVSDPLILGLNVEYINVTESATNVSGFVGNRIVAIRVDDGFILIPVELTAHYLLPFSTESFKFLMSGGAGYYNGIFVRKIGTTQVSNISKETAFGIHVSVAMEYVILENLLARFQMKFRDPDFTVSSKYDEQEIQYRGEDLLLPDEPFDTKINMDGIAFSLGLAFQF